MNFQKLTGEVKRLEARVALALAKAAAASSSGAPHASVFVYRPGGVAAGNVYSSWAALWAQASTVQGPVTVQIDDSIVSPAVVPAGTYPIPSTLTLDAVANPSSSTGGAILQLADGAHFTLPRQGGDLRFQGFVQVQSAATTAIMTCVAGQEVNVTGAQLGMLEMTAGAPFFHVQAGAFLLGLFDNFNIGDGTHAAFVVDAAASMQLILGGHMLLATGAITASAGAALALVQIDSQASNTPFANVTTTLEALATKVAYAPAVPANWVTVPAQVAPALDELAASLASGAFVASGFTTTAMTAGQAGYISGANVVTPTDNATLAKARIVGVYTGVAGQMQVGGVVPAVLFTTAGGAPANGAPVFLANAGDDGPPNGVGKFTATAPTTGEASAEVGICIDNSNYAGSKTAKILLQPKSVVQL